MSSIEDEIKDRLGDEQSLAGLDSGAIWDSVAENLDSDDVVGGFFTYGRVITGVVLLLGLGAVAYLLSDGALTGQSGSSISKSESSLDKTQSSITSLTENSTAIFSESEEAINGSTSDAQKAVEEVKALSIIDASVQEITTSSSPDFRTESEETSRINFIGDIHRASSAGESKERNSKEAEQKASSARQTLASVDGNQGSSGGAVTSSAMSNQDIVEEEISVGSGALMDDIHSASTISESNNELILMSALEAEFSSDGEADIFSDLYKVEPRTDHRTEQGFAPSELFISAGVNALDQNFNGMVNESDLSGDLSLTTMLEIGASVSLRATWKLKNGLRLSTGLDYDQLRNRFDRVSEQEVIVTLDSQLIGIEMDPQGVPLPVYGQNDYSALEKRTVIHYNHFDLISIPLEIGIEKQFKRTSVGIDLGLSYRHFIEQAGRSLDENSEVSDFSTSVSPFKKSGLAYQVRAFAGLALGEKVSLRVSPSFKYLPSSLSKFHGIDNSAIIMSGQIGIVYDLR